MFRSSLNVVFHIDAMSIEKKKKMGREVDLVTDGHEGWNSSGNLRGTLPVFKVKSARWKDSLSGYSVL